MSLTLALLIAALIVSVVSFGIMFVIAIVAAPRGVTTGPTVTLAQWLFTIGATCLAIALAMLAWGLVTSWA